VHRAGLSHAEFGVAMKTLTLPHERRFELHVLDLADGSHLRSLTQKTLDGQVAYDVTADVTRMLDIHFIDEKRRLGFEPDDPSDAPLHRSRLIRVHDCRYIPELTDWVEWPVFTGPIIDFDRTGADVNLTCHGMEEQAFGAAWQTMHFPKKSKLTTAIRQLLAAAGDVNANVPDLPRTFPKDHTIHPLDSIWPHVQNMARSLDHYAFYDGAGRFQMRPHNQRHVYRFDKALTSEVSVKRQTGGFINTVVVLGPKPHGPKKHRIRGVATLEGTLSPQALSRNGVAFHAVQHEDRDFDVTVRRKNKEGKGFHKVTHVMHHLKGNRRAKQIADRILLEHATTRTDLAFDAMPLPFLEEYDMVGVTDDAFGTAKMRMRQWSLPLEGGEPGDTVPSEGSPMTVGSIKRTTRARLHRR
jgi:hypothetical protein